jgi:hypothetical protein
MIRHLPEPIAFDRDRTQNLKVKKPGEGIQKRYPSFHNVPPWF